MSTNSTNDKQGTNNENGIKKGTYAAVTYNSSSLESIKRYMDDNNIQNQTMMSYIHTTILFSFKPCPDYVAAGDLTPPYKVYPKELDIWTSAKDEDGNSTNILVLKLSSDDLTNRHDYLMRTYEATYNQDLYRPHIALSYDVGDVSLAEFTDPTDIGELEAVHEFNKELELIYKPNVAT